jgi:hypothetical protein
MEIIIKTHSEFIDSRTTKSGEERRNLQVVSKERDRAWHADYAANLPFRGNGVESRFSRLQSTKTQISKFKIINIVQFIYCSYLYGNGSRLLLSRFKCIYTSIPCPSIAISLRSLPKYLAYSLDSESPYPNPPSGRGNHSYGNPGRSLAPPSSCTCTSI